MRNNSQNTYIESLIDTGLGYGNNTTMYGALYRAFYGKPT
jgi:hypothetical protein